MALFFFLLIAFLQSIYFFSILILITLQAVDAALNEDQLSKALILSLRLNEDSLIKKCIFTVNPIDIPAVAASIPYRYLQRLIEAFADFLESCPHLEFILRWCQVFLTISNSAQFRFCIPVTAALFLYEDLTDGLLLFVLQELCNAHGNSIQQNFRQLLPALKSLQKAITRTHRDLADTCSSNEYMLRYLCSASSGKWKSWQSTNFAKIFRVKDYCLHCNVLNQLAQFGTLLKKLENSYATICKSWTRTAICWLKYNPCNKVFRLLQVYLHLSSCCLSDRWKYICPLNYHGVTDRQLSYHQIATCSFVYFRLRKGASGKMYVEIFLFPTLLLSM